MTLKTLADVRTLIFYRLGPALVTISIPREASLMEYRGDNPS
jgi:hypothetical protein